MTFFTLPLQPGRVRLMLIRDVDTGVIVDADVFPTADAADAARSALLVGLDGEFRDYPAGGAVGLADVAAMRAVLARAGRRDLADIAWNHLLPPDLPMTERRDALRAAGYPFLSTAEPSGPGVRCPGCGALPDEQHREECAERDPGPEGDDFVQDRHADLDPNADEAEPDDPGPVAPSPWGDRPEPEDPDRDRMDDAELASHQAHEPEPWT